MSKKIKEQTKVRLWIVVILVVAVILGVVDYPKYVNNGVDFLNEKMGTEIASVPDLPFHLGLDLQGGTHLVYEADTSGVETGEEGSAIEGVRDVIERRVNALGVAEPIVQTNESKGKWRVIVELAGVKDVNEAINMIGETPLLEFKEENNEPQRELTAEEEKDLNAFNAEAKTKADEAFKKALNGDDFATLALEYSDDIYTKDNGGEMGLLQEDTTGAEELYAEINSADLNDGDVYNKLYKNDEGYNILKLLNTYDGEEKVAANHILICYEGATRCTQETSKDEARAKIEELKAEATPDNFVKLAKENSTEPGAETSGGDLGWFARGVMVEEFGNAAFDMEVGQISDVVETEFGYHLIFKTDQKVAKDYRVARILLQTKSAKDILPPTDPYVGTELSGKQLVKSLVSFDPNTNEPQVSIEFNNEGKELFAEITERNVGKPVAIYLDGSPISVPTVNEPIRDGKAVITGRFDVTEARQLAQRLNAGALPVPINLISQQTVGATLGHESLTKSLNAGLVGLLLIILFMIIMYRLPGVLSVVALLIYASVIVFLFKIIPITLTLSGIAGFILSIGMAVDANVLIFERLKEELKTGKPLSSAVDEGFKRAWTSIRDGNVSTLITCFILAWFGTSMIQGFAITLGIGVLLSMFSAIVVTRLLLKLAVNCKGADKKLCLFGVKK